MGKILGVVSIKGGVGKTTTVAALGAALAQFDKKVLLVDANFSAPNLGLHIGVIDPEVTLHDVLDGDAMPEDAILHTDFGFDFIAGALIHGKVNPFRLKRKINQLRDFYDVILLDSSPALNEEILAVMVASDQLFVVTTPDHVTLSTTMRAVKLAKEKNTPIHGLILNKVYDKSFELSLEDIEAASETNVLAVLPHEVRVLEALSRTAPATRHSHSGVAVEYMKLAAAVIGETYQDSRLLSKFKRFFSKPSKQEVNRSVFRDLNH